MSSRRWSIGLAAFCAVVFVADLVTAVLAHFWINYVLAAVMAACFVINVRSARQRKADTPMALKPSNDPLKELDELQKIIERQLRGMPTAPPKPKPQDFTGLPFDFAVGEVYGLRMWHMDKYGRLYARNWKGLWRPGVNVAKCIQRSVPLRYGGYSFATSEEFEYRVNADHAAPSESCACGFYAYTDPLHAETAQYTKKNGEEIVLGVIKGTGKTLIGTMGFRCEKAEIVALVDPLAGGDEPWRQRQAALLKRVYPDVPLLPSRAALLEFAPLTNTLPDPSTDEFWSLP